MRVLYDDAITSKGVPSVTVLGRIAAIAVDCDVNITDKDISAISDEVKPLYIVSDSSLPLYTQFTYIRRISHFEARNRTRLQSIQNKQNRPQKSRVSRKCIIPSLAISVK